MQTLPAGLSGARPRYGYGFRNFQLVFASDVDRALYICAQTTKSKADAQYRDWLRSLGLSDQEIDARGQAVRRSIKSLALSAGAVDVLSVPEWVVGQFDPKASR